MLLIVLTHVCQHGIWFKPGSDITVNLCITNALSAGFGAIGCWLFVMISGFFISQSEFSWKKVFKLWFEIFFYSAIIGIILYIIHTNVVGFSNEDYTELGFFEAAKPMGKMDLIRSLMPTFFGNNWFASAYILFYCFTPFLNESLKVLDEKKHRNLIILMTICGTIVYMIYGQGFFNEGNLYYFILGYYVACYIKLYNPKFLQNKRTDLLWAAILILCFMLWTLFITFYRYKIPFINSHYDQVFSYPFAFTRFPCLLTAIFLFGFFNNLKMKNRPYINTLASAAFGVYLIHENLLLNKVIWHKLFRFDSFVDSTFLPAYIIFVVIATYLICAGIDLLRQKFIEKPMMALLFPKRKIEGEAS